jgi:hypothetical protein
VQKNPEKRSREGRSEKPKNDGSAQERPKRERSESPGPADTRKGEAPRNGKTNAERRNDNMNTERRNSDTRPERGSGTSGQAGADTKLSSEQRTKITTVIRERRVQPETHVNFNISVGTRVPKSVHFHPLPADIVTIYPRWRGYEFFLVGDQIIVVNPRTLAIVAVLEA